MAYTLAPVPKLTSAHMRLRHSLWALAALALLLTPLASAQSLGGVAVSINENDADQTGTDNAEFTELYNASGSPQSMDGFVLVYFNGSDDASYNAVDLDGVTIPANGYWVYCGDAANVPNCDLEVGTGTTNLIQNGADGVALYVGDAADFPEDTPATTTNLIDALVYGTNDSDDAGLLAALGESTQYDEDANGAKDTESIQRSPDGDDTVLVLAPTPGAANGMLTEPEDFTALLRGENEVPAVETMALGGASATLDGTTLVVTGTFAGLSSDYLFAHLHRGAEGENGPVAYTLTLAPPTFGGVTEGSFPAASNTFTVTPAFADSLRNGLVYVNIHSADNPDGELRGQLGTDVDTLPFALSGDNEVPPVDTDATGFGTVTLDGTTLSLSGTFMGLGSDYLFSHIHAGAAGMNGPVAFTLSAMVDGDMRGGSWSPDDNTFELDATFADSVRAGLAYVNVHSADNPNGELRAQIGVAEEMPVTIAEARAAGVGATVTVEGTVSRAMGAFTYIQDATGGLTIRQTGGPFRDDVEAGAIAPGTMLTITGTLSEFRQLLQINGDDLVEYSIDGQGEAPAPQVVSLSELAANGEAYEAELVFVTNLTIDEGDDRLFQSSTNYAITDDTDDSNAVNLRVVGSNDTMIDGTAIPPDPITVIGVVGQFNTDDPTAGYQILPILRSDVVGTEGDPADVQVIHNAPDPAAEVVDVYIDGVLILDDLAFQTGTPFVELPTGIALDIAVAPGSSTSADDAVFTTSVALNTGRNYQIVAQGVLDPSMFADNPDGVSTAFTLALNDLAKTTADEFPFNTEINFFHGSPDAPAVDIRRGVTQQAILFNDVTYGDFSDMYTPAPPQLTRLEVTSADGVTSFGNAELDLGGRGGEAGTLLASGFADPSANQDGAPLSLLIVFADGSSQVGLVGVAGEETGSGPLELALETPAPNPAAGAARVAYAMPEAGAVTVSVYDALGRRVATLVDGEVSADRHVATLDARALAAGVYVVRLQTEAGTLQKTFTVVR